ncbi:MAG: hypothetical protein V3T83_10045 [Acidobacteriota bacterium]
MIGSLLEHLAEYWPVHLLLTAYAVMLAYHAWSGHRQTKGLADYYVGGRSLGGVTVGLSFFATYSSTNSFVGFAGQAYSWGTPWLLLIPCVVFFSLLSWWLVAPRLRRFSGALDSLTVPDLIGFRFGSRKARLAAAVLVLAASFFYTTAVFKGIGNLLELFIDIPYKLAILIVFLVVSLYTLVGGFISVAKTDAVQGIVMALAAVMLFAGIVTAAGGLGAFWEVRDQPGGAILFQWGGVVEIPFLLGILFAGTFKTVVDPRQLSRFYALKGRQAMRTGLWVSTLSFCLVYSLLVPLGIYARRIIPDGISDTDLVIPTILSSGEVFSAGVSAFLLVAMVAAAMSSLDSVLLVMASTAQRDILELLRGPSSESQSVRGTRLFVALFALITALIAMNPPGGIVSLTAFSGSLYAVCFFPAVVLGLYWRRGSGSAVLGSFATGTGLLLCWPYLPGASILHPVFPAFLASLLTYLVIAFRTPIHADERIEQLFSHPEEGEETRPSFPK